MQIGTELRRIRKSRHQTLADVGAETGYSASFLSVMERGQTNPSLETLDRLASYYGVPVDQLLATSSSNSAIEEGYELRPGFREFLAQMGGDISDKMKDVLLYVDNAARQRAQSKDDWMRYYYLLSGIVG